MYRTYIRNQRGVEMGGGTSKKQPAPRGGSEKELRVEDLDLHVRPPKDKYKCTPKQEGDKNLKLVIRRGELCHLSIGLDSPWENDKHSLALKLAYGPELHVSEETLVEVKVDDTRNQTFAATQWGAYIHKTNGKTITLKVHVPSNCIVGAWKLEVTSYCKMSGTQQLLSATYEHNEDLIILFNPWCKDDLCYMPKTEDLNMPNTEDLNEYVLNEDGIMYQGNPSQIKDKSWTYGQEGMLDAALDILTHDIKPAEYHLLADPVKAVRRVAMVFKSGLVLRGSWPGIRKDTDNYNGGTKPWVWNGSVDILEDYMKKHKPKHTPVKYGQCWVFSGVTNTVLRALGIPCRSVTCFISGFEDEGNNTVDRFYKKGKNVTKKHTKDFVWTYHVWNEVWLKRPDLDTPDMDGWQALDTTGYPPHESDKEDTFSENHRCGPTPVLALKHGYCNLNYDAGVLFCNVNADVVYWEVGADDQNFSVIWIDERSIGQSIITKNPGTGERLDVKDNYKFSEGGPENREKVLEAHKTARNRKLRWPAEYDKSKYRQDVKLKLSPNYGAMIGEDLTVDLRASNTRQEEKRISTIYVSVFPKMYNGAIGKAFVSKKYEDIQINGDDDKKFSFTVTKADYSPHLLEDANLLIEVYANVISQTGNWQHVIKSRDFTFTMPALNIQGQTAANVNKDVEYAITFTNPLSIPLTQCVLSGKSQGFRDVEKYCMPDIQPGKTETHRMTFVAKRPGRHSILFNLDTKELDFNGKTTVDVAA